MKIRSRWTRGYSKIGSCDGCDMEFQDMNTVFDEAKRHARRTGHVTHVEVAAKVTYSPALPECELEDFPEGFRRHCLTHGDGCPN